MRETRRSDGIANKSQYSLPDDITCTAFVYSDAQPAFVYAHTPQAGVCDHARLVFGDFEDNVGRDTSKTPPAGGTVHPLCAHALSYLKVRALQTRCMLLT